MRELITVRKNLNEVKFANQAVVDDFVTQVLKSDEWPFESDTEIPFVRKYFIQDRIETKSTAKQKLDAGQVLHYISTAALDRDHEIMKPEGVDLKHYRKNPMVLWSHDPRDPDNVMGKNLWIQYDQKGLMALTQFALSQEKAAKVYNLYRDGFLRAWSVGFTPLKGRKPEKDEKLSMPFGEPPKPGECLYIHEKWALFEYSAVGVPSNQEALTQQVAKGYELTDELVKELELNLEGIDIGKTNRDYFDMGDILKDGEQKEEGEEGKKKKDGQKDQKTDDQRTGPRDNQADPPGKGSQAGPPSGEIKKDEPDEAVKLEDFAEVLKVMGDLKNEVSELKAGREISGKNMKLLTEAADKMDEASQAIRKILDANSPEEDKSQVSDPLDVDKLMKEVDIDKEEDVVLSDEDKLSVLKDINLDSLAQEVIDKRKGKVT